MAVPILGVLGGVGNIIGKVIGKAIDVFTKKQKYTAAQLEAQSRINEAEVAGAPASGLRLWRSFLGWILSLLLVWEMVGRMVLIPLFWPDKVQSLPPSVLEAVLPILMGMLGLN